MSTTIISDKGMIMLPNQLRDRYGLRTGTRVHILDYGEVLAVVPTAPDPIAAGFGLLRGDLSLMENFLAVRKEGASRAAKK